MKGTLDSGDVQQRGRGERPLRKLFSKEQRAFFAEHAPGDRARRPGGARADLRPQAALHAGGARPPARRRDVALPGRLARARALDAAATDRGVPGRGRGCGHSSRSRGVDLSGEQQTKTRKALEYFARRAEGERADELEGRPALGVAHLRRELRRGRRPPRRADRRALAGERRGLPALGRERRVGQGARRPDGREAARARRRRRARAVAAGDEGRVSARRRRRRRGAGGARRSSTPARASRVHARPAPRRAGRAATRRCGRSTCTSGASTTRSAARWPSCPSSRTDEGVRRTIAVESEDPALVLAAVRELGLAGAAERQRAAGLKALAGFGARVTPSIDVGTNSVKFRDRRAGRGRRVDDGRRPRRGDAARRGSRPRPASSATEPIARTVEAIAAMADEAEGATASRRSRRSAPPGCASRANSADVRRGRARADRHRGRGHLRRGGGPARLRRGDVGARGSATARSSSSTRAAAARSSRSGAATQVDERFSVNVGAARFTERFGLDGVVAEDGPRRGARTAIAAELERLDGRPAPDALVGIGGAVTNLAAVKHGLEHVRPGRRPRARSSTAPRSTARSSSTARGRPTSGARSPASSRSAPR